MARLLSASPGPCGLTLSSSAPAFLVVMSSSEVYQGTWPGKAVVRWSEPWIRNLEAGIRNLEAGTRNPEAGIRNLEPGTWNLEEVEQQCSRHLGRVSLRKNSNGIRRVHAQQYQKQQGNSTAIITRSCKFGMFDPQGSVLLIDRQQHLCVARFRLNTVDPDTSLVDRYSLITVDRRHSASVDRHHSSDIDRYSIPDIDRY
ncbi:hypothetical protein F2Q69_00023085 [Brassica cretica]|uniref:Uncharacterized protein n=1 Tax=Brassica cretica TaxID=69181 RepID=A0A8S9QEJ3_BRACR|nr:hypothetical protein F2Q69_00023085 [Brassica cretica]